MVVSEINPPKLANMGKTPEDLFALFRDLNYAAFQLNEHEARLESIEHCAEGDVVFVPRGRVVPDAAAARRT